MLTTTLPGEEHGLGVLMAECAMAYAGCALQSLGLQTPVPDIVSAVQTGQVNVVGLGFSGAQNPRDAFAALSQLRELLDRSSAAAAAAVRVTVVAAAAAAF